MYSEKSETGAVQNCLPPPAQYILKSRRGWSFDSPAFECPHLLYLSFPHFCFWSLPFFPSRFPLRVSAHISIRYFLFSLFSPDRSADCHSSYFIYRRGKNQHPFKMCINNAPVVHFNLQCICTFVTINVSKFPLRGGIFLWLRSEILL